MKTSRWGVTAITTPLGGLHLSKDCHQRPGRVHLGGLGEGLVGDGEQVVTAIADASERMPAIAAQEVSDQNSLGEVVVTPFALTGAVCVDVKAFHTWETPRPI